MPCLHQMDPNNFLEQNFIQTLVLVIFCWIIEWFLPGNLNWTWRKNLRRRIRNLRVRDLAEQRHRQDERVFGVPEELLQSHGRGRRGFESSRKCLTNKERWIFFFVDRENHMVVKKTLRRVLRRCGSDTPETCCRNVRERESESERDRESERTRKWQCHRKKEVRRENVRKR